MPLITFIDHNGKVHNVKANNGDSLMQSAMDNLVEGIVAECGGASSCATCHVYVDESWQAKVGPADELEKELIECTTTSQANSRLSCQITISDELDGLVVRIPESQYGS